MTPQEKQSALKTARLMRAARKQAGFTQEHIAQQLTLSQSALSKMENGTLIPSAPQWFEFCRLTGIQSESLVTGMIECNRPAELRHGLREGTFKLPKRYASDRGSKVRALLPILSYLHTCLGEKDYRAFLKSLKVDPDYFVDVDNQINVTFVLDVVDYLISSGNMKPKDLSKLTAPVRKPEMHGSLHFLYDEASTPEHLLNTLFANSLYYECNFGYRIEESKSNRIDISAAPQPHIREMLNRNSTPAGLQIGRFLCEHKLQYFRDFLKYRNGSKAQKVSELEGYGRGEKKWVYRVELAS